MRRRNLNYVHDIQIWMLFSWQILTCSIILIKIVSIFGYVKFQQYVLPCLNCNLFLFLISCSIYNTSGSHTIFKNNGNQELKLKKLKIMGTENIKQMNYNLFRPNNVIRTLFCLYFLAQQLCFRSFLGKHPSF